MVICSVRSRHPVFKQDPVGRDADMKREEMRRRAKLSCATVSKLRKAKGAVLRRNQGGKILFMSLQGRVSSVELSPHADLHRETRGPEAVIQTFRWMCKHIHIALDDRSSYFHPLHKQTGRT